MHIFVPLTLSGVRLRVLTRPAALNALKVFQALIDDETMTPDEVRGGVEE